MRIASVPLVAIKIPIDQGGMDTLPTGVHEPVLTKIDAVFVGLEGMYEVYTVILFNKVELVLSTPLSESYVFKQDNTQIPNMRYLFPMVGNFGIPCC